LFGEAVDEQLRARELVSAVIVIARSGDDAQLWRLSCRYWKLSSDEIGSLGGAGA